MIFENLADRLQETFKKLRGHGKLTADDVNATMREIRIALLEADVNFKVVKDFIKKIKERAVGQEVLSVLLKVFQGLQILQWGIYGQKKVLYRKIWMEIWAHRLFLQIMQKEKLFCLVVLRKWNIKNSLLKQL